MKFVDLFKHVTENDVRESNLVVNNLIGEVCYWLRQQGFQEDPTLLSFEVSGFNQIQQRHYIIRVACVDYQNKPTSSPVQATRITVCLLCKAHNGEALILIDQTFYLQMIPQVTHSQQIISFIESSVNKVIQGQNVVFFTKLHRNR